MVQLANIIQVHSQTFISKKFLVCSQIPTITYRLP